jgi:hypothetical protein
MPDVAVELTTWLIPALAVGGVFTPISPILIVASLAQLSTY